ncbi:MAG TPA: hypothetical protein VIA18_26005, partial [Polyangia bacterium]|nr:hypothetical protein [Polyangia bacterium]
MATRTTLPSLLLMPLMVSCSSNTAKSVSKMGQPDLAPASYDLSVQALSDMATDMTSVPFDLSLLAPINIRTPPATGAYLGAFVGVGNATPADFQSEEQLIARPWVIDNT